MKYTHFILIFVFLSFFSINSYSQTFGREYIVSSSASYIGEEKIKDYAKTIILDNFQVIVTCGQEETHSHVYELDQIWQKSQEIWFTIAQESLIYYEKCNGVCTVTITTQVNNLEFKQVIKFNL